MEFLFFLGGGGGGGGVICNGRVIIFNFVFFIKLIYKNVWSTFCSLNVFFIFF